MGIHYNKAHGTPFEASHVHRRTFYGQAQVYQFRENGLPVVSKFPDWAYLNAMSLAGHLGLRARS
jgi:hypothetical protein